MLRFLRASRAKLLTAAGAGEDDESHDVLVDGKEPLDDEDLVSTTVSEGEDEGDDSSWQHTSKAELHDEVDAYSYDAEGVDCETQDETIEECALDEYDDSADEDWEEDDGKRSSSSLDMSDAEVELHQDDEEVHTPSNRVSRSSRRCGILQALRMDGCDTGRLTTAANSAGVVAGFLASGRRRTVDFHTAPSVQPPPAVPRNATALLVLMPPAAVQMHSRVGSMSIGAAASTPNSAPALARRHRTPSPEPGKVHSRHAAALMMQATSTLQPSQPLSSSSSALRSHELDGQQSQPETPHRKRLRRTPLLTGTPPQRGPRRLPAEVFPEAKCEVEAPSTSSSSAAAEVPAESSRQQAVVLSSVSALNLDRRHSEAAAIVNAASEDSRAFEARLKQQLAVRKRQLMQKMFGHASAGTSQEPPSRPPVRAAAADALAASGLVSWLPPRAPRAAPAESGPLKRPRPRAEAGERRLEEDASSRAMAGRPVLRGLPHPELLQLALQLERRYL